MRIAPRSILLGCALLALIGSCGASRSDQAAEIEVQNDISAVAGSIPSAPGTTISADSAVPVAMDLGAAPVLPLRGRKYSSGW